MNWEQYYESPDWKYQEQGYPQSKDEEIAQLKHEIELLKNAIRELQRETERNAIITHRASAFQTKGSRSFKR